MERVTQQHLEEWLERQFVQPRDLFSFLWHGRAHNYVVSQAARRFLTDVLQEAFDERLAEQWPLSAFGSHQPDSLSIDSMESILRGLEPVLHVLLEGAYQTRLMRGDASGAFSARVSRPDVEIGMIDVLTAIHLSWCNIWPFCRPTPPTDLR
jgi:hypothetical protein